MLDGGEIVDQDIERLKALCGMLTADTAGERANAASLASKHLKSMGLTWAQLVESAFSRTDVQGARARPQPGQPHYTGTRPRGRMTTHQGISSSGAIHVLMTWLREEPDLFSDRDSDFIRSINNQGCDVEGLTGPQWKWVMGLLVRVQQRAEGGR